MSNYPDGAIYEPNAPFNEKKENEVEEGICRYCYSKVEIINGNYICPECGAYIEI